MDRAAECVANRTRRVLPFIGMSSNSALAISASALDSCKEKKQNYNPDEKKIPRTRGFGNGSSYQSDETKSFAFVDEDLTRLPILDKKILELLFCDVTWQITDEQTAALCVLFLTGFQQHGQSCLKASLKWKQIIPYLSCQFCHNWNKHCLLLVTVQR